MQVERESLFGGEYSGARVSNTWVTYPLAGDNISKEMLIPHKTTVSSETVVKGDSLRAVVTRGWARGPLASWWGNGLPRLRWLAGLRG